MSYALLRQHRLKLSHLAHVEAITSWDEAVMMPPGSGEARGDALATLRVLTHHESTRPELADWLHAAEAAATTLAPEDQANLREMRRAHVRATAVPARLVEACSKAESRSEQAWRTLRAQNDWAGFLPLLTEVVALRRESAQALGAALGLSPYDALMDGYEPGARAVDIQRVFTDLEAFLPAFIDRVIEKQAGEPLVKPEGTFSVEAQRNLGLQVMKAIGFDFQRGRLDVSHHPFCGGVPQDVRITTRYSTDDFTQSFMGVLHETGHAKYEQNLPAAWAGQPAGVARSMSVHESQSLFQEMQVGRSPAFLAFAAPLMAAALGTPSSDNAFSPANLARLYTRVRRSLIRVDADECTYPCHVILRFQLEQGLVSGSLAVKDIPEAWDAGMKRLLDVDTRGDFKNGCMQDVHWSAGLFGYFPTYTLGALTAAQLFAAVERAIPKVHEHMAAGNFAPINDWLRTHIWSRASLVSTDELLKNATGSTLNADAFKRHLNARYLSR